MRLSVSSPSLGDVSDGDDRSGPEDGVRWRAFYDEARARLEAIGEEFAAIDARRIVEEAAGAGS